MGLDMYLRAKRYLSDWRESDKPLIEEIKRSSLIPEEYAPCSVTCEAAYWRKSNHVHQWFVDNVQNGVDDCGTYYVSQSQLKELLDRCKTILADRSLASEVLPTQSGFFFGATTYDDWYYGDLEETVQDLEKALAAFGDEWDFEYHSSW